MQWTRNTDIPQIIKFSLNVLNLIGEIVSLYYQSIGAFPKALYKLVTILFSKLDEIDEG